MTIWFDMDGTIANLYGEENWLSDLISGYTKPYRNAKPLVNMHELSKVLNELQARGFEVGIISWLSKNGTDEYNAKVTKAKKDWLIRHLSSVHFNSIHIVEYGTPKQNYKTTDNDVLFDDELNNRLNWGEKAFDVNEIIKVLESF